MITIILIIRGRSGWHIGNVLANGPKGRGSKPAGRQLNRPGVQRKSYRVYKSLLEERERENVYVCVCFLCESLHYIKRPVKSQR